MYRLFTEIVLMLSEMVYISLKEQFIDGAKLESKANEYTLVWKKSVEKNKAELELTICTKLEQIEEKGLPQTTPRMMILQHQSNQKN